MLGWLRAEPAGNKADLVTPTEKELPTPRAETLPESTTAEGTPRASAPATRENPGETQTPTASTSADGGAQQDLNESHTSNVAVTPSEHTEEEDTASPVPVSYTHLTLPTIYSV